MGQRTILSPQYNRLHPGQKRPRSRTLTSVHNDILEDIVHPTQIVGKRVRVRTDNSKLLKVYPTPRTSRRWTTSSRPSLPCTRSSPTRTSSSCSCLPTNNFRVSSCLTSVFTQ